WQVKGYDPLVQHSHIEQVAWQDVLQCDAISIHTPLTKTGEYPTYHLFDELAFEQMNPQAILMNAARGEVVKQSALLQDIALRQRTVILDVFEFEPNIQYDVLDYVKVVTPHIAGYSLEGKIRGTAMLYERVCQHFQRQANKSMYDLLQPCETRFTARPDAETLKQQLKQHLPHIYQIMQDDQQLRQCLQHGMVHGDDFDALRKHYHLRREWSAYGLELFQ
ncbi:MAG: DUF3410 domain-containing protein, partial [Acinetobacter sp.]|nr:DUF3410 domain-containing protein [Acinetobacter sp.]